jgi:hypothetical protein
VYREPKKIGVVQGSPSAIIQPLLAEFAARNCRTRKIVGVVEQTQESAELSCDAGQLVSLLNGQRFQLFQDLGPGSTACRVYPEGALFAAETVRRDIEAGCDLVILSKYGKLEAERQSGLLSAFVAAIEIDAPILTSVAPKFETAWKRFASGMYVTLQADADSLENWWWGVQDVIAFS